MENIIVRYSLLENEIGHLPEKTCEDILGDYEAGFYIKNHCHLNALTAAKQIKWDGANNKIVEGVVKLEDGFLFEHFWNEIIFEDGETAYFDVSLGVLGSEKEKNTPKTYYSYKTLSIHEMESRTSFCDEIFKLIEEYYESYPEHKDKYFKNKESIDNSK